MYKKLILSLFFILFTAFPAYAAAPTWMSGMCSGSGDVRILTPGTTVYACFSATVSDKPPILQVTTWARLTFDPDRAQAAALGAARIFIIDCLTPTYDANTCDRLPLDMDYDGDLDNLDVTTPLNGDNGATATKNRKFVFDLPRGYYTIEVSTPPAGGEQAVVKVDGYAK